MSKLIELNNINAENFIDLLRSENIVVYEQVSASKLFFNISGNEVFIKQKNLNSEPINRIDMVLQNFYNPVITYLENLDIRVKNLISSDWWFCCEYFPDEKPANIRYDEIPNNNLILTGIFKDDKYVFDVSLILEYAKLLNIEPLPILFYGILSDKQLELIRYFLNTSKEDLEFVFGKHDSFASFFYKILNPIEQNSFLMSNFNDRLERIIIKTESDSIALSILNPLYIKTEKNNSSDYLETSSLIVADFVEFLSYINFNTLFLKEESGDEQYIEAMSNLFNIWISKKGDRLKNFVFEIPPYFYEPKFQLNINYVKNKQTLFLIESSEHYAYMFKIILTYFRYKRAKEFGVVNTNILKIMNQYIQKINDLINKSLNIQNKGKLLDFSQYSKVVFDMDSTQDVYPQYNKKIEPEKIVINNNSKKGGKK